MAKQLTMFTPELPLPALARTGCGIHLDSGCPRLAQAENGPP